MCALCSGLSLTLTTLTSALSVAPTWKQSWSVCGRSTAKGPSHGGCDITAMYKSLHYTCLLRSVCCAACMLYNILYCEAGDNLCACQQQSRLSSAVTHQWCAYMVLTCCFACVAGCPTCAHPTLPGWVGPGLTHVPASTTSRRLSALHCSHQRSSTHRAGRTQSLT